MSKLREALSGLETDFSGDITYASMEKLLDAITETEAELAALRQASQHNLDWGNAAIADLKAARAEIAQWQAAAQSATVRAEGLEDYVERLTRERDDYFEQLAIRSDGELSKELQRVMAINNDLVRERDEARNKALDEAAQAVKDVWEPGAKHTLHEILRPILALKTKEPTNG